MYSELIIKEYQASTENLSDVENRVKLLLKLIKKYYKMDFDNEKVINLYFMYTDQLFDDLEDISSIPLEYMIRILIKHIGNLNE